MVTKAEVLAFLDRDWDLIRESKDRYLAQLVETQGPDAAFDLAAMLHRHAEQMGARSTVEDREADLATAVRLRRLLDRAGRRSRRPR